MDIQNWIDANALRVPDKPALRRQGEVIGYAALARRIEKLSAAFAGAGVRPGDCVAWLGPNSPALLTTLFACARLGALFMPLNWRLAPPEHRAMLRECPPVLLIADDPFTDTCATRAVLPTASCGIALGAAVPAGWRTWEALVEGAGAPAQPFAAEPARPLLLCYTSGSTGCPKGVLLSRDAFEANADASVDMHALSEHDRVLTSLPLFHVGGLNIQTLPALRAGCTVTLLAKFDPDATFDAIERERITLTVLVPAQLDALIAHPRWAGADLSSLRMISTGSTLVPQALIRAVHARGVPLVQVWGATETSPIAACLHADEALRKAGSAGRAALGVELRIVDVDGAEMAAGGSGEILVRGRAVTSGYWRDPDGSARTLAGGWFHSGDRGHLDDEGFLWVDGRLKDMIICGGENISPAEVEAVLLECPDVAEAAVVGRPDPHWGEVVVAVVAPKPGGAIEHDRVLASFEGRLARYKHPRHLVVVESLPRSALGKVRKEDVRQLIARLAAAATPQEHDA